VNISDLKTRLTIQEPVRAPDGGGGFMTVWQNIAAEPEVFAQVVQTSGNEALRAQQITAQALYRITLRYRADITPAHRMTEGGSVYNIAALRDPDGAGEWLEITATMP
jgi:SPP1 family predicted phage head-tail adaptor